MAKVSLAVPVTVDIVRQLMLGKFKMFSSTFDERGKQNKSERYVIRKKLAGLDEEELTHCPCNRVVYSVMTLLES